jgi:plastocyanin
MLWKLFAVTLLALGLTLAAACGDDDDDDTGGDGGEPTAAETNPAEESDTPADATDAVDGGPEDEPVIVSLDAIDSSFSEDVISAPAGSEVTVEFANLGELPHTFSVDQLEIDEQLAGGENTTITFTMPDEDTPFYCAIHPAQMTGTLQPE